MAGANGARAMVSRRWEMQFLSDLYVRCPECEGTRYRPEVLKYLLDGKSIREILQMTVSEAFAVLLGT